MRGSARAQGHPKCRFDTGAIRRGRAPTAQRRGLSAVLWTTSQVCVHPHRMKVHGGFFRVWALRHRSRGLRSGWRVVVLAAAVATCGVQFQLLGAPSDASAVAAAVSPLETPENNAVDRSGTVTPPLQLQWRHRYGHYVTGALAAAGLVFASAGPMVYALDPHTGGRVWGPVDTGSSARGDSDWVTLAYDAGRLFVGTQFGEVIAYDASSGHRLWWHHGNTVTAGYGAVLVTTDSRLTRLDERTGKPLWHFDHRFVALPAITADEVVLAEFSQVWGLRLSDGALLWHSGDYTFTSAPRDRPVIANDRAIAVYQGGPDQTVLDRMSGASLGTVHGDSSATVVADIAVVRSGSSFLGENVVSGDTAWTFTGDGHLVSRAIAEGSDVYVASSQGQLWAIGAADGNVQWQGAIPRGYGTSTAQDGSTFAGAAPMTIGEGLLLVPVDHQLVAFRSTANAGVPSTAARPQPALTSGALAQRDASNQQADARHAGRVASAGFASPLRKAWTRDFGGPVSYAVIGVRRAFAVTYAHNHSYLYGLSRRTGRSTWPRVDIGSAGIGAGGACMDDTRVYVTSPARSVAVDRATGHVVWSRSISATRDGSTGAGTSVCTVSNGSLYVEGPAYPPPYGGMVFAVNAATGHLRWATGVSAAGGVSAVAVRGNVVLLNLTHYQAGFDAADGHRLWWSNRGDGYSDQPAVAYNGRFWVLDDFNGTRDPATGRLSPGFSGGPPAFFGSRMFLESNGELRSEDVATRLVTWQRHPSSPVTYPPLVVNRRVFAVTADGVTHAFTLGGREVWHGASGIPAHLGGYSWPGPLYGGPQPAISAAHGTLIVPTGNRLTAWVGS